MVRAWLRRVTTGARLGLWWLWSAGGRRKKAVKKTAPAAAGGRRAQVLALSRQGGVRGGRVTCIQGTLLVTLPVRISVEGGGLALLPETRRPDDDDDAAATPPRPPVPPRWRAVRGASTLANLVLGHAAVPGRLTPADLGCGHLVVVGRDHPGVRLLLRPQDDLLPLLLRQD